MTVCTDVYVRPQTCDEIFIYPSQVHPTPSPDHGGGGGMPWHHHHKPTFKEPECGPWNDWCDEDIAILIAMGVLP